MKKDREQGLVFSWYTAMLHRAKRFPSLRSILRFTDKPKPLSPEEAERETTRHKKLIERLAPDASATEDQLKAFVSRVNREYDERHRVLPGIPES